MKARICRSVIARGALPLDETLPIAKQIADALEAAHAQGIIHRDLKPANIKLRPDGTVKVLDFGLAKSHLPAAADEDPAHSPTITVGHHVGVILGTAAYMSPEQARGRAADKRADLWAFGCIVYELITGRPVFARDTADRHDCRGRDDGARLDAAAGIDAGSRSDGCCAAASRRIRSVDCVTSRTRVSTSRKRWRAKLCCPERRSRESVHSRESEPVS